MDRKFPLKLSIIVPIYNVEKYLERCVNSLLCQDIEEKDYEILLINDGSTDNSYKVAQKLAKRSPNIKLFSKENGGLSSTRNYGIAHAQGKYIMHVDSDDFLENNVVGKILDVAEKNDLELCFFHAKFFPDRGCVTNVQPFNLYQIYDGEYVLLHGMKVSSTWSNIYSSDFLKKVGIEYYGRISHQDVEYNLRLYPFAKRIMFTDIIAYNYFVEDESILRTNNPQKKERVFMDNVIVARNVKQFAQNANISYELKKLLNRRMNSVICSQIYSLCFINKANSTAIKTYIHEAKSHGVYPIKGGTESWKMTILSLLFNQEWLLKLLVSFKH